jgi:hypothetical protein
MKLGILFTSRNNYDLLDYWLTKVNTNNIFILNIDEDSTIENKDKGRIICEKHNVTYMDREERGMQNNITSACSIFKNNNLEWILWFQHDCFPIEENFFERFNNLLEKNNFNEFGVVGFNVYHDGVYQMLSRSPLQQPNQDMWVRYNINQSLSNGYEKIHSVESVSWMSAAVNINQYEKHIKPTGDYQFFHAWDDIAYQFLYKNIHNVCIPFLNLSHEQIVKKDFNMPVKSPLAKTKQETEIREHFYGKWGHHEVWSKRWGFEYDNNQTYEEVKGYYQGTLINDFYNNNVNNGPLKTFEYDK